MRAGDGVRTRDIQLGKRARPDGAARSKLLNARELSAVFCGSQLDAAGGRQTQPEAVVRGVVRSGTHYPSADDSSGAQSRRRRDQRRGRSGRSVVSRRNDDAIEHEADARRRQVVAVVPGSGARCCRFKQGPGGDPVRVPHGVDVARARTEGVGPAQELVRDAHRAVTAALRRKRDN